MRIKSPAVATAIRLAVLRLTPTRQGISDTTKDLLIKTIKEQVPSSARQRLFNVDGFAWAWLDKKSGKLLVGQLDRQLENDAYRQNYGGVFATDFTEDQLQTILHTGSIPNL